MRVETYFGKDLEKLEVTRVEPNVAFLSVDDVPVLFDNMYLLDVEDRDLMLLLFMSHKKQEEIGNLFNVTQEAVSYQIKKLRTRIRFIKRLRSVQPYVILFFDYAFDTLKIPEHFVESAVLMFFTTSQTASARVLGVNQATVRYRFGAFIKQIRGVDFPKKIRCVARYMRGLQQYHNKVMRIRRN